MNKLKSAAKKLSAAYAAWVDAKTEYNLIVQGSIEKANVITFNWKKIGKKR